VQPCGGNSPHFLPIQATLFHFIPLRKPFFEKKTSSDKDLAEFRTRKYYPLKTRLYRDKLK
jgi:hypothetical protein